MRRGTVGRTKAAIATSALTVSAIVSSSLFAQTPRAIQDPFGSASVIEALESASAEASNRGDADSDSVTTFDDENEGEGETIVIRDLKDLPEELREVLNELPQAERDRIETTVRERGLKLPIQLANPKADAAAADPARQEASRLLAQFSQVKSLSRSTVDVLAARAEQLKGNEAAAAKAAAAKLKEPLLLKELLGGDSSSGFASFRERIIAGDWAGLQKQLTAMPPEVADGVYSRMLELLSSTGGTMVPHEILDLADAAPKKLSRRQINTLGSMLRASLITVDEPTRFLERLGRGSRRLGGKDPELRIASARLLLDAGLTDEVAKYLLPLDKARKNNDAEQLNTHGALLLQQAQKAQEAETTLVRAWVLFLQVLQTADPKSSSHREALERVTSLISRVPPEVSGPWLRQTYEKNPPLGMQILSQVIHGLSKGGGSNGKDQAQLRPLKYALEQLAPAAKAQPELWSPTLQLTVSEWCKQIESSLKNEDNRQRSRSRSSDSLPIGAGDVASILSILPDEACLAVVEPETAWKARELIGKLTARVRAKPECFASIMRFAEHNPPKARQLAELYLQQWSRQFGNPQEQDPYQSYRMQQAYGMGSHYSQHFMSQNAVPLTRARQVRNLAEMRELLDELVGLGVSKLDEKVLVGVFTQIHSPAEIYRREDVEKVFGSLDEQSSEVVAELVSAMRINLAGQWRKPDLQEAHHTNRTDAELVAELGRGYSLALEMLSSVVDRESSPPKLRTLLGTLYFDQAEFLYGQQVDLKTYTTIRDQAFAQYRLAHEAYAKLIADKERQAYDATIYMQWFQSALGASDLAYLSRQDEPDRDQIDQIAASIHSLGPQAAAAHIGLFGTQTADEIREVPAHLKPWFLREALRIVGNHESGKPLLQLADLYHDLLKEIELHIRIDGSGAVGREPFGAHLVIRGTTAMMREGQSFSMLLSQGYSYATNQEVNHKEKLEKEIRAKLGEAFEVQQVRFHEPTVQPRTFGRDDWRELPLAYLVLKAKDPAVDRIPSIDLDLEYSDGQGFVVLPIHSPVQLIDARSPATARPLAELKIKQVLDDRKFDKHLVRLEVSATGKGLIPELEHVLQLQEMRDAAGKSEFKIADVVDHGVTIGGLDVESEKVRPQTERRWTIDLTPRDGVRPVEFAFPTAAASGAELTFVKFDDADLATTGRVVALRSGPLTPRDWLWPLAGFVVVCAAILGVAAAVRRAKRRSQTNVVQRYQRPSIVTPFSAIALLKQLVSDPALRFSETDRGNLTAAIRQLEDRYFARAEAPLNAGTNGHGELDQLLGNWLHRAAG